MADMVCKVDDDYVRDKVRWVVILNNGETIYEDDDRPGQIEPSAWKRLYVYCAEYNLFIVEMWLQFRSNRILIEPKNASGYYFVKCVYGIWGEHDTHHAYIVGVEIDNTIKCVKWKIPELVGMEPHTREIDQRSFSIISRKRS